MCVSNLEVGLTTWENKLISDNGGKILMTRKQQQLYSQVSYWFDVLHQFAVSKPTEVPDILLLHHDPFSFLQLLNQSAGIPQVGSAGAVSRLC